MCRTYNMIGSLASLKTHLEDYNIHDFKSLKEVIDFQNSYSTYRQQVIDNHENLIEHEKETLRMELQHLDVTIETEKQQAEQRWTSEMDKLKQQFYFPTNISQSNIYQQLTKRFRYWNYNRKLRNKKRIFDGEVLKSIDNLIIIRQIKQRRYQFISSHFNLAVEQSSHKDLSEMVRKKSVVDRFSSLIYGAIGEHKVVKRLMALTDEYFLINDFTISFSPAIYNKQENDYIKSVQIDHLLVAPSGIFLIETKNWSKKSLEDLSLFSPVRQIKRSSYALYRLLNNEMSNYRIGLDNHHWGDKKISIKNLLVLTNRRPKEEFKYVKILTLNELPGYINHFEPTFSNGETQRIADFLLRINDQKRIEKRRN